MRNYILVYYNEDLISMWYKDYDYGFEINNDSQRSTSRSMFTHGKEATISRHIKQGYIVESKMDAIYVTTCEAKK